jgi:Domain of Unknown Function (DUF1080)
VPFAKIAPIRIIPVLNPTGACHLSLLCARAFSMSIRLPLLGTVVLCAGVATAADPVPPNGFTVLFNGKDFTGWRGWNIHDKDSNPYQFAKLGKEEQEKKQAAWNESLKKHWTIDNGELVNKGEGAYLTSEKDYGDYELLIEYKLTKTVDAGIYPKTMPQIQVWDPSDAMPGDKLGRDKGSGGLWNNTPADSPGRDPLVKADNPPGEWNKFRIINVGERISIYLNGKLVVDHARLQNYWDRKLPVMKAAPILLQTHAPKLDIRWRNIFVKELTGAEANEYLAKHTDKELKEIFNGKDFTGWQGATDNYEVVDGGAVRCKKGKGGFLYTKEEYADFQVALEFKVPKNGNNGLAIRYPGTGDGAYSGMCELQVLDDNYKGIDPRQAHGSAYGIAAAARGYQRPVGEWNYQVVTVKGSTIDVELNGTRILNTDVSKVTEYMAKSPHPGKDRTKGYFGFCGHNDPVEFRNVKLKELK